MFLFIHKWKTGTDYACTSVEEGQNYTRTLLTGFQNVHRQDVTLKFCAPNMKRKKQSSALSPDYSLQSQINVSCDKKLPTCHGDK